MIETLPNVTIGGSNQLFGGYIYNLQLDVQTAAEGKTELTVDLFNESSEYFISESDLNTDQRYDVRIANFKLPMFMKSFRKTHSPKGDLLQIVLMDGSFKLDLFEVGLNKRIWDLDDGKPPKHLIVVGKEIHPCDVNRDGKLTDEDLIDPCDPCVPQLVKDKFSTNNAIEIQRGKVECNEITETAILDVQYSFNDLILAAGQATGIKFANTAGTSLTGPNPKYLQKYTGSLRSVLRSWAADFGWTFFFTDNTVTFIDLTHVIEINRQTSDFCPNIAEWIEEYTLEGTVAGSFAANFTRQGQRREVTCQDARYIVMTPYVPSPQGAPTTPLSITNKIDTTAAGLCRYSPYLRDLYWWFIKEKMGNISNIQINKQIPQLGLTILSQPITLQGLSGGSSSPFQEMRLEPSASLDYVQGYPQNQADVSKNFLDASGLSVYLQNVQAAIESNENFKKCFLLLTPKDQWAFAQNADQYYFFFAHYDSEVESQYIQEERDFADDFMGRYYVYSPNMNDPSEQAFFEDERLVTDETKCGYVELIEDGKLHFETILPNEDSARYYAVPAVDLNGDVESCGKLPFARWLKLLRDYPGAAQAGARRRNFKVLVVSVNGDRFFPNSNGRGINEETGKLDDPNQQVQDQEAVKAAHSYYIKATTSKLDETGDDVVAALLHVNTNSYNSLLSDAKEAPKVLLFWGRKAKDTDFSVSKNTNSFHELQRLGYAFDGLPMNARFDNVQKKDEIIYKYPGLRCKQLGRYNNLATRITFKTPGVKFEYTEPSYSLYGVVIEKTKTIEVRNEKMNKSYLNWQEPNNQTLALQVNQQDLSDDAINNRTMTKGSCRYDEDTIQNLFDERAKNLTFSHTTPLQRKTFTIAGQINNTPSILDGLMSISMAITPEAGLQTTYVLGTMLMTVPNPDIFNGLTFKTRTVGNSIGQPYTYPYK